MIGQVVLATSVAVLHSMPLAAIPPPPATPPSPATLRVVDEQRRPVAGARVRIWLVPTGNEDILALVAPLCEAASDDQGRVACSLPRGRDLVLAVDAPAFAPWIMRSHGESQRDLVLPSGQTLTGKIVGPAGIPIAALRVALVRATANVPVPELRRPLEFIRTGKVQDDGRVAIAGLPAGTVTVRLDVPRFLPWTATRADAKPLRVKLVPGVLVEGTTHDRQGSAVVGAVVEVDATDEPPRAESDKQGRFAIAVADLPVRLRFSASGYRTATMEVPAGKPKVVAILDPGQGVRGTLLADDQRRVDHAELWYEQDLDIRRQKGHVSLTPRAGAFKADLSEPGLYTFRFESPGIRPEPTGKLEVTAGHHLELGTVRLHTGAGVAGVLVNERDRNPVSGALIELIPQGVGLMEEMMYHYALRAVSDGEGLFTLTGAAEGSYLLKIEAAGVGKAWKTLNLAEDVMEQLGTVPLGPGVEVAGRVATRAGKPVVGASVRWFDTEAANLNPLAEATTGEDGRFNLRLAPGTYLVRVARDRVVLAEQVEIAASERKVEVNLVSPGVRLSGVVVRAGNAVSGGSIRLIDALDPSSHRGKVALSFGQGTNPPAMTAGFPETSTFSEVGPDGRFVAEDISVGVVRAFYVGTDGRYSNREFSVPDQAEAAVVIELDGAALVGTVVDDRGVPIEEATVTLLSPSGDSLREALTGRDGAFRFADLQPGTYGLSGQAKGYRTNALQGVSVAGDQPSQVRLTLTPGSSGSLAVKLWRAGGRPAAFVALTLLDRAGSMVAAMQTDSSGERTFTELPAGGYVVAWSDPYAGVGASGEVQIDAEARARFERGLEPGVGVNLRCMVSACSSAQVGSLQLFTPLGLNIAPLLPVLSPRLCFSDDGWLRLGTLSPGPYTLQILVGTTPFRRDLVLTSGETTIELP